MESVSSGVYQYVDSSHWGYHTSSVATLIWAKLDIEMYGEGNEDLNEGVDPCRCAPTTELEQGRQVRLLGVLNHLNKGRSLLIR